VPFPEPQAKAVLPMSPPTPACRQFPEVSPVPVRDRAERAPVKVGALVTVILGVVPPEEAKLPEAVTDVTVPLPVPHATPMVERIPAVPACTHLPDVRAESVTFKKVGAEVIDTAGVVPPVEEMFPVPETPVTHVAQAIFGAVPPEEVTGPVAVTEVTVPFPVPHAPTIVVSRPPVPAWTQLPGVRGVSVRLPTVTLPEKVGAEVIEITGAVPPVLEMFPVPETLVTVPPLAPGILAITLTPPVALSTTVGVPVVEVPSARTEVIVPQLNM